MSKYIKIDIRSYDEVIREGNPDDKWDRDDTRSEHTINGFEEVGEKEGWDFVWPDDEIPVKIYIVYVLYDTGDSFGRSENNIELIGLYKDIADAEAVGDAIESDYKEYDEDRGHNYEPLAILLPVKQTIENVSTSTWKGYFEHFNSVEVRRIGRTKN